MTDRQRAWNRRRPRRPGLFALAAALLLILLALFRGWQEHRSLRPPETLAEGAYRVQRVVDGDTLLLSNHARLRLIGVNAPETVKPNSSVEPFGPEASAFTKRFVAGARGEVRLEFDRQRLDKYGRFLAYVYAGGRMLNEELIAAGLARVERGYDYSSSKKTRFLKLQAQAQAARRGLWSRVGPQPDFPGDPEAESDP